MSGTPIAELRKRMAAMSGQPDQHAVDVADPVEGALPMPSPLSEVLPHKGIARGTVACLDGMNSVLIAVIAEVTRAGGQVGIVGLPRLGLLSAAEMGADLSRIATVPLPGADPVEVAAVLLDGMDLVVLGAGGLDVAPSRSRVVMGRARKQSSVLLVVGGRWPGAQTHIDTEVLTYRHSPGLADPADIRCGFGRIGGMRLRITVSGRSRRPETVLADLVARPQGVEMVQATTTQHELAVAN
ncbi:hypothetical protein [Gordonia sp. NPDC003585]|uniref:hypothetical protein n=2 Tax=unclassified Gordonia (in: high G+C Gram-positive bacteria) TaxID=2657482 RepID=UPI00339F5469